MNEWISVKERLPRKQQKVLFHWVLTDSFGQPCVMNVSMGYMCGEGWNIYLPYHSFGLRDDVCPVTHWCELPEFPKPEIKEMEVGEIIIDDPLARLHEDVYKEIMVHGECVLFFPNDEGLPTIQESATKGAENAKEFAKKFCEKNADLLKRLADR